MKYFIVGCFLLISACAQQEQLDLHHDCSVILSQNGQKILENAYYKVIQNEGVFAIKEKKILDDSLSQTIYNISPVYPITDSADWSIDFKGKGFEMTKSTLVAETTSYDSDASYGIYSLQSGSRILEYTYDKLEVLFIDDSNKRYLGFYSKNGVPSTNIGAISKENTLGIFSYASQDGLLNTIRLEAIDANWLDILDVSNPVLELMPIEDNAIQLNAGKKLYFTAEDGFADEGVDFDLKVIFYTTDTYKPVEFMLEVRANQLLIPKDFKHSIFQLESL